MDKEVININDTKLKLNNIVSNDKPHEEKPIANEIKESPPQLKPEVRQIVDRVMREVPKKRVEKPLPNLRSVMSLEKEKRELILMITRYKTSPRFGEYLQDEMKFDFDIKKLSTLSCEELQHLLNEFCIANKN